MRKQMVIFSNYSDIVYYKNMLIPSQEPVMLKIVINVETYYQRIKFNNYPLPFRKKKILAVEGKLIPKNTFLKFVRL